MPWRGASYPGEFPSLGWGVIEWIERYFVVPDGPLAGQPLRLTVEQKTRIVRWYALDEHGKFIFRRGAKRGPKGEGKSPEAALMAIAELCGPVVFAGWDAAGEPVGRPPTAPWVQVAACSDDQTDNTYGWLYALVRDSSIVDAAKLDIGITRINLVGRPGKIETVTASSGSREGQRVTFGILDETHLWTPARGGPKLAAVLRRNAAKMGGRTWETTNAYVIGEKSVAEVTHTAAKRGAAGLLYESKEAPADTDPSDPSSLRRGLVAAYGDSLAWVDIERLVAEIDDPATSRDDCFRFYLNIPVEVDFQSWLVEHPGAWAKCEDHRISVEDAGRTAIAVDMSLRHDSTSVVVAGKVGGRVVVRAAIFTPPAGGKVDYVDVRSQIRAWAVAYHPSHIVYDPRFLEFEAAQLSDEGLPMLAFPQSAERMVPAGGHLLDLVVGGQLAHDGDALLADHVAAAVWREGERGRMLSKGKSTRPIDAVAAMAMACSELEAEEEVKYPPADIL